MNGLLNLGDWLYVIVFVIIGVTNKRFIQEEVLTYSLVINSYSGRHVSNAIMRLLCLYIVEIIN